jgi:hypothetical protein
MISWNQNMFTTTQYLFDVSTTWQYMLVAAVGMFAFWIIVSIVEKFINNKMVRILELYLYRPVLYMGSLIIVIGVLFYMIIVLKDYIWGVG